MFPTNLVIFLAHNQYWTLSFPEPLLKCFFMDFANPFLGGNFIKQPGYILPEMWVLGALNLPVGYFRTHLCLDIRTEQQQLTESLALIFLSFYVSKRFCFILFCFVVNIFSYTYQQQFCYSLIHFQIQMTIYLFGVFTIYYYYTSFF